MYFLVYRSRSVRPMDDDTLRALLAQSRERNLRLNITGILLYFNDAFVQLLEGEEKKVRQLYADIRADKRHYDVRTLKEGPATGRRFPGWSMSFRAVNADEVAAEPAFKDVLTPGTPGAMDVVALFRLLRGK